MIWQPSASIENLKARARLLANIRQYFANNNVLEVETPLLCSYGVTDRYMRSIQTHNFFSTKDLPGFLQTSPEYAMKRLLASGSGDIFQICKAFRQDEAGARHNPEFSLLEWYRVGFDEKQLMDDVFQLLVTVLPQHKLEMCSYHSVFDNMLSIDPLSIDGHELEHFALEQLGDLPQGLDRDDYLSLLFEDKIEPQLGKNQTITFVTDFPASQAALARINSQDSRVACRFEVYIEGVELANGFYELADDKLQIERFERDNKWRQENGLETIEIDHFFIDALKYGLPDCSGVALGIDRLLMIMLEEQSLDKVLSFPFDRI